MVFAFKIIRIGIFTALLILFPFMVFSEETYEKWIEKEFVPSTLTRKEQLKELAWFRKAAKPYRGMTIRVISERINTHIYESNILSKAFSEITGIKVIHEVTGEDDLVKKIDTQMNKGINLYDMYVNDSDFIGTHVRNGKVVILSDFMEGEGKDVTLPTLDIKDFMGIDFTRGPDGKIYQLPDQQFVNLYWYRADWFKREDLKKKFREIYGYDLNVPLNWSAYEDIAEFFTRHVKFIDGVRVYGHMDYGRRDPSIGWRFSDAWLSMAGVGDKGYPNGKPVDEWGIRVENCRPVGASVARGGAANGPAAVYALKKYVKWLKKYAPPEAIDMNFTESGSVAAKGYVAQQIFWYSAFMPEMIKKGSKVVNSDGTPKWRMAPSPHGAYWQKGMKMGYQDTGAWTMIKGVPLKRRKAAWLYAQFVVSKTVSLKKTIVGLTPIRISDINSEYLTKLSPRLGGLVEFYRSKKRLLWSPTGTNVPNYPYLSTVWWRIVPKVIEEGVSAVEAMDRIATDLDNKLLYLSKTEKCKCSPKLNPVRDPSYWLNRPGSPKKKLANENPSGKTVEYEKSLKIYD